MGRGLAQALITSSAIAFNAASPMSKVTPLGYFQYLLGNNKPRVISNLIDDGSGYIRNVVVRSMPRGAAGQSSTTDDCGLDVTGGYVDQNIGTTLFRKLGIPFEDDAIAKFEQDALASMNVGAPPTAIMKEMWDVIISKANGLLTDIDNDLLAIQAVNFGVNVVTGLNTAKSVNFAFNGTNNDLTAGMTGVMADAMANELNLNGASIVGSGIILNYFLQQKAKSPDQAGVNTSQLFLPDFKYDPYAQTRWGANQFAMFEKDAVQFVNICRFRGAKAGLKGSDYFFTLRLPVADSVGQGNYRDFEFDVQLTYRTCPGEVQVGPLTDANPPMVMGRGWNIILMSSYQQVNIPTNAYVAADRMYGNNGTYLFTATNS